VSFAALRGLAREFQIYVPSIAVLVFMRDLEPTVLRAVDGLWHLTGDITVDTVWKTV